MTSDERRNNKSMKIKARDILPSDIIIRDVEWGNLIIQLKARVKARELTAKTVKLTCEWNSKPFTFRANIFSTHTIERKPQ